MSCLDVNMKKKEKKDAEVEKKKKVHIQDKA